MGEQLSYFLEHCTSESDAVVGIINFVIVFIILPVMAVILLIVGFFWFNRLFLRLLRRLGETQGKTGAVANPTKGR